MDENARPRRQRDYRLERLGDELLLYHPGRTKLLYCNPTASVVWQLCDGTRTVAEIVAVLVAAYPEAAADIPDDVAGALRTFYAHGALELL
jgi:hypothetical protein